MAPSKSRKLSGSGVLTVSESVSETKAVEGAGSLQVTSLLFSGNWVSGLHALSNGGVTPHDISATSAAVVRGS